MLRKLELKGEADVQALPRVMAHVFSDGVTNWGRVVTLIAFGAFVAKHLHSTGRERCVDPLARGIADVLVGTKRDWLVQQRGWVSARARRPADVRTGPPRRERGSGVWLGARARRLPLPALGPVLGEPSTNHSRGTDPRQMCQKPAPTPRLPLRTPRSLLTPQ